ncbi:hypothetical protein B0H13DRAFT_804646 [Mycena leptocephala]|nr:hypothetical protein B0H13DRAFT_804646 [Mycena leptocephala]
MSEAFAPTAIALREAPKTLLRNRNPDAVLGIRDSKLAAVIEEGSYFVTTPNAENILAPPSGAIRSLLLRRDGLWGDDDPIRWPQIFSPSYCHFSAIPSRPQTTDSEEANKGILALWYNPTREHLICPVSGRSILRGCGNLPCFILEQLRGALKHVQKQFEAFLESDKIPPLLPHLMQTAVHAFTRLEVLPVGYMELLLTVRALQRSLLEAIAIMDYKQIYQPRIEGLSRRDAVGVDLRMGAFTADLRTVEDHLAAGLKVWFIQPSSAFRYQNILRIAPLIFPETMIEMTLVSAATPPTFIGNNLKKFDCIHHLTRKIGHTPDPFNPAMESTAGPSRNASHSRSDRTHRAAPYSNRKESAKIINSHAAGRDKFKPVHSPYMPDYIPGWKSALSSVNSHRSSHPRSPADGKYMFPDVALFCTAASDDRKARYFATWTYMRTALIYRVFGPTATAVSAEPLSSQDWRDILNGSLFKLDAGSHDQAMATSRRGKPKVTKTRAKVLNLENLLRPCLQQSGSSLDLSHLPELVLPTANQARACLWEISELNFRLEFIALDKRLHVPQSPGPEAREQLIYPCFPGWTAAGFSLVDCDLRYAKQGLAAQDWKEKLTFLLRLNTVMRSWAEYDASHVHISILDRYDEAGVSALEFKLARFYTQSFFESFGRPATIPMALV